MSNFYHPHFPSFEKAHIWNFYSVANFAILFKMKKDAINAILYSMQNESVGDTEYQVGLRLQDTQQ